MAMRAGNREIREMPFSIPNTTPSHPYAPPDPAKLAQEELGVPKVPVIVKVERRLGRVAVEQDEPERERIAMLRRAACTCTGEQARQHAREKNGLAAQCISGRRRNLAVKKAATQADSVRAFAHASHASHALRSSP